MSTFISALHRTPSDKSLCMTGVETIHNPFENSTFFIEHLHDTSASLTTHLHIKALPVAGSAAKNMDRLDTENFIKSVYHQIHHAKLDAFMPILFQGVSMGVDLSTSQASAPLSASTNGAIGLRHVDNAPIFLERYLSLPIEQLITNIAGHTISRYRIVEIGNLASSCAGSARLLIAFLVFYLSQMDDQKGQMRPDWAVCTGTKAVRHILASMGVQTKIIATATPEALQQHEASAWGSYYQHNPLVLAINVHEARQACEGQYFYGEMRT